MASTPPGTRHVGHSLHHYAFLPGDTKLAIARNGMGRSKYTIRSIERRQDVSCSLLLAPWLNKCARICEESCAPTVDRNVVLAIRLSGKQQHGRATGYTAVSLLRERALSSNSRGLLVQGKR